MAIGGAVACNGVVGDAFDVKLAEDAGSPQQTDGSPSEGSSASDGGVPSNDGDGTDAAPAVQPSGPITWLQSTGTNNFGTPATSISVELFGAVQAGHKVIVALQTSTKITRVTDGRNTYSLEVSAGADNTYVAIYSALNQVDGDITVNVEFDATAQAVLTVHEYKGVADVDQTSGNSGNGTAIDTGTVQIVDGNQLLFAFGRCNAGIQDAPSKDFTVRRFEAGNLAEDRIVAGGGTYSATFTAAGDSGGGIWTAVLATFKGAKQ